MGELWMTLNQLAARLEIARQASAQRSLAEAARRWTTEDYRRYAAALRERAKLKRPNDEQCIKTAEFFERQAGWLSRIRSFLRRYMWGGILEDLRLYVEKRRRSETGGPDG